jgi:hypothetical protein
MNKDEVFDSIVAARLGPEDLVYVGRSGNVYYWGAVAPGQPITLGDDGVYPEVWTFSDAPWPGGADMGIQRQFFDELVAQMEGMANVG